MISKVFFLDISRFYTSRAFQRYQEHPNRTSDDKVMVLRSWSKNRKVAATSRRENQRRDVAESCRNDVATLPNDVETLGVDFDGFLAHFEPIMEDLKAQTIGIERGDDLERVFGLFEGEQAPFGWKHLGLVLGEISRVHSMKRKNT